MQANQPSTPYPFRPPSRQNKVLSQREYREREMESFNTLRDLIRILTGEELRTRQEILKKAIDLILSLSGIGNQSVAQASNSDSHERYPSTSELSHSVLASPAEIPEWHQTWPSDTRFSAAAPQYGAQSHQQFTPNPDYAHNQFDSPGWGGPYDYH